MYKGLASRFDLSGGSRGFTATLLGLLDLHQLRVHPINVQNRRLRRVARYCLNFLPRTSGHYYSEISRNHLLAESVLRLSLGTQCRLGRGLPPYQVASSSIQSFGHNRHGPKIGCCAPFVEGELGPHIIQCGLGLGLPPCQVSS